MNDDSANATPETCASDGTNDAPEASVGNEDNVAAEANANGRPLPSHWKRTIAIIWTGQAASVLATCAATFAVIWHITVSTDSALMLSAAGIAALLPAALLSPFGGVAADRFNRKHVMIASDAIAGAFSLTLACLASTGQLGTAMLLVLLVARSAAQAFHGTSLLALMPELVPERDMVRINSLDQVLTSGSAIGGPMLGIALYNLWGFSAVLLIDAACAAIACICLAIATLPYAKNPTPADKGVVDDLREGLQAIGDDKGVASLLAMAMVAMLLFLPLGTLSPLMTYDWFEGDGFAASVVEAAGGIGLLVGSLAILIWGGGKRLVPLLVVSGAAVGAICIACGLLPSSAFPAFVALVGVMFAATGAFNAPIVPLMQRRVAPERFGRVMGLFSSLTTLATPLGLLIAGPAAEALGVQVWFIVCGSTLVVAMVALSRVRPLQDLDRPAQDPAA